jgi:hypothetical protein
VKQFFDPIYDLKRESKYYFDMVYIFLGRDGSVASWWLCAFFTLDGSGNYIENF